MTTPADGPRPIPVHVTNGDELARYAPSSGASSPGSASNPRKAVYRTVTLTAADQVQEIMAASDDRIIAWVVVIDADVFIADNKSDAAAGRGAYVPCVTPTAAKPNLAAPYPVQDNRVIYAAPVVALAGSNVIRVSVNAIYKA